MDAEGRLTLTSGVPETFTDVVGATTLYWSPLNGNRIGLWDASFSDWVVIASAEKSLSASGLAAGVYDLFGYLSAGALVLEWGTKWTDDVTRAVAIALQDGVKVKSGAPDRRLLGTVCVATGLEDSRARRWVSNLYNPIPRPMLVADQTDVWTYSTAAFRQANGSSANQLDAVCCVDRPVFVRADALSSSSTSAQVNTVTGIGLDSTTIDSSIKRMANNCLNQLGSPTWAELSTGLSPGRHFLAWLEYGAGVGGTTQTWIGDAGVTQILQTGISGWIEN